MHSCSNLLQRLQDALARHYDSPTRSCNASELCARYLCSDPVNRTDEFIQRFIEQLNIFV